MRKLKKQYDNGAFECVVIYDRNTVTGFCGRALQAYEGNITGGLARQKGMGGKSTYKTIFSLSEQVNTFPSVLDNKNLFTNALHSKFWYNVYKAYNAYIIFPACELN